MLVDPKLDEVVNGPRGMLLGIDACLRDECLVSAITLMFSTIDALAALTRPIGQQSTNGKIFKGWVTRFIKPKDSLNCSEDDLWGARCGVLHLYSPESDLAADNKARRIYYQWRDGPATSREIPPNSLIIIVEDLYGSMRRAIDEFMFASEADEEIKKLVKTHLPTLLCYEPFPALTVIAES